MVGLQPLSPQLRQVALNTVNEEDARREEAVNHIRQWILQQPHLTGCTDDHWIISNLRVCKYSLQRTKQKIDTFYSFQSCVPQWLRGQDVTSEKMRSLIYTGVIKYLGADDQGRMMLMSQFGKTDPKVHTLDDVLNLGLMSYHSLLYEDDRLTICGLVYISDASRYTVQHVTQMTPSIIKNFSYSLQEACAIRPQAIHIINLSPIVEPIVKLGISLAPEKLRKRVHVHSDMKSLFEFVPSKLLPDEIGGTGGSEAHFCEGLEKILLAHCHTIMESHKYGLKPGFKSPLEDEFGEMGSFRKLEVD